MSSIIDSNSLTAASAAVGSSMTLPTAKASAPSTGATSTSSDTSTQDITADDFLTLLVTEMKNQDPTQPTDPNAYIQQLTEVNSLQQLIAINQDLTPQSSAPTGSSTITSAISN